MQAVFKDSTNKI